VARRARPEARPACLRCATAAGDMVRGRFASARITALIWLAVGVLMALFIVSLCPVTFCLYFFQVYYDENDKAKSLQVASYSPHGEHLRRVHRRLCKVDA